MYYKDDSPRRQRALPGLLGARARWTAAASPSRPRASGSRYVRPQPPGSPGELTRWWLDPEDNLERMLAEFEGTYYGGEAYPGRIDDVPGRIGHGRLLRQPGRAPSRDRLVPPGHRGLGFREPRASTGRPIRCTGPPSRPPATYAQESRDRYLVSLPELGSASDDLSLLRGMQPLVLDMIQQPSPVKAALSLLADAWVELDNEELYAIAADANDGGCPIAWMQTWAPGPHYQMSCDFSAVLSPALFDRVHRARAADLPAGERVRRATPGMGPMRSSTSTGRLLAIDGIDAIRAGRQGAGSPPGIGDSALDPPVPQGTRRQAEKLILPFVETERGRGPAGSDLVARGLLIGTTAQSEEEARDLLRRVEGWTRD